MGKNEKDQLEKLDRIISHRDQIIFSWRKLIQLGRDVEEQFEEIEKNASLPKKMEEAR